MPAALCLQLHSLCEPPPTLQIMLTASLSGHSGLQGFMCWFLAGLGRRAFGPGRVQFNK